MSKTFDNLNYGAHFTDEFKTRWIKLNLNSSWYQTAPFFNDHTGCRRSFNSIDYNGMMAHLPFDLPVEEIINPNLLPLSPVPSPTIMVAPTPTIIPDAIIGDCLTNPQRPNVGLDILQSSDIISPDLDNTNTDNTNQMNTATTAVATVPQVTLREAVVSAVNEFKSKGSFSIHDATLAVRAAANGGEIALPGMEAQPNQSGIKYWVENDAVKRVIQAIEADGTLANMGLTNVDYSGPYRVYQFSTPVAASAPVATATPASPDPATVTTAANPSQSPLAARVQAYLTNVGTATLKQVQSALKVNGVTCKDLATIVAGLGYVVTPGTTDCFSTYVVS